MTETQSQTPLRIVPDDADTVASPVQPVPAGAPPLRPIVPEYLKRGNRVPAARRRARYELHRTAYHGTRSPAYLLKLLFWGVTGTFWLFLMWLRWWLSPVPVSAHQQAVSEGWRSWKTVHGTHVKTTKTRAWISFWVALGAGIAAYAGWSFSPWTVYGAGAVLVVVAALVARPEGTRIVTPHAVPSEFAKLTPDVITRALGSLGNAKIDRWLREGKEIDFIGPVRQDGPGWRFECNLPYGATATEVVEKRAQFASGLRRPLGAVWPECITAEHPGRLEGWVGQQDITSRKPVPWPLLKGGTSDVFKPVPAGTDPRGRQVKAPLIYHNWLIGSQPGNGKTGTVVELAAAGALDPLPELMIHELKGTGDLDAFDQLCTRFSSGIDDNSIGTAAESLAILRRECERRGPLIKALPTSICPEKRVTRQIAEKYAKLRPVICIIDECQNLFAHPKYGKQAGIDAEFVIKLGRALGIVLILATQRPDKDSLPTGVSGNVSIRFCLYVAGQVENDMILGTSAYKNGIRATMFRPETDAGLGYLKGAAPAPQVIRTHYMNVPERQAVVARAKVLRERAGTLPAGADNDSPERDVLADVLAVMDADPGLHWEVLAERLAQRWPQRWAGASKDAVSMQVQALGVPSVTVSTGGQKARGCRKDAIELAMQ